METNIDNYEPTEFFRRWRLYSLGKLFGIRDLIIQHLSYLEFYDRTELKRAANTLLREIEIVIENAFKEIK